MDVQPSQLGSDDGATASMDLARGLSDGGSVAISEEQGQPIGRPMDLRIPGIDTPSPKAPATTEGGITVSAATFARLAEIAEAEGGVAKALRVAVLGGGCSGFQYEFALEDKPAEGDLVLEGITDAGPQRVFIDPESLPFLEGSVIDFKDELIGARFAVENPNATSTCGCGTSFSL